MACGAVTELTEQYGTYFFMHRQFACIKSLQNFALHYGVEQDGGNHASPFGVMKNSNNCNGAKLTRSYAESYS